MTFDQIPADAQFTAIGGKQYARISMTERQQVGRFAEAFGVVDAKGREFGHICFIDREYRVIDASGEQLGEIARLELLLGNSYIVRPHALRDGKQFGPLPVASYKRFKTLEEAEAYALSVIARSKAKAVKKAVA